MAITASFTRRRARGSAGFTLLEVLISLIILTVGMLALVGLISKTSSSTDRSRYMSMVGLLTSEKLEELTRLPASDPAIAITAGSSSGSLTANTGPVTVGASKVSYYDEVYMSSESGKIVVTTLKPDGTGYLVLTQDTNAGTAPAQSSATQPAAKEDQLSFERRWVIEDSTVTGLPSGVRRVTVLVRLLNSPVKPDVTFQMSTVRQ